MKWIINRNKVRWVKEYVDATSMRTKATVVEGVKPCCYQKKNKNQAQKPAAMDSCFGYFYFVHRHCFYTSASEHHSVAFRSKRLKKKENGVLRR